MGHWAQRIRSRSAETITGLTAFMNPADVNDQGTVLAEVFPAGQEAYSLGGTTPPVWNLVNSWYLPNGDSSISQFTDHLGGTTVLWPEIDESVVAADTTNFVQAVANGPAEYAFRVATAAFPLTARVVRVALLIYGQSAYVQYSTPSFFGMRAGGNYYWPVSGNPTFLRNPAAVSIDFGEINPVTMLPWTPTDIRSFDAAGAYTLVMAAQQSPAAYRPWPTPFRVYAVQLQVSYQTVETRVAAAVYAKPFGTSAYSVGPYAFQSFGGIPTGSSWAKPASGDFTVLFRPPAYAFRRPELGNPISFAMNWSSSIIIPGPRPCSVPGVVSGRATFDFNGACLTIDFTDPALSARTSTLLLTKAGPSVSDDSLPYVVATSDGINHTPAIYNTQSVRMQFTSPSSGPYKIVKVLLDPRAASASLTVSVKRTSDNVQFGSTETLTPAQVKAEAPDVGTWRMILVALTTNATLVSGTRYYVELASADTTAPGLGWVTIMAGHSGLAAGAVTFGGTTDSAVVGGIALPDYDVPFRLSTPPSGPTGAAVAVANTTNAASAVSPVPGCVPAFIQALRVTWTSSVLGATFAAYEIQRRRSGATVWETFAALDTEATNSFIDYETPRGETTEYRIRSIRNDGAPSDWSTTAAVAAGLDGCDMLFVSNEAPFLNCAYTREPLQDYVFQEAARDELVQIYGSDDSVAFMEAEDAGITVGATLTVNFGRQPTRGDVVIYDPLRAVSRAALSYVCVLDHVGNRFFAHVQFGAAKWEEPGFRYHADVVVTEVTQTPTTAAP